MINNIIKGLQKLANPQKAIFLSRFFKTGRGEYGEGDKFLGITVPMQRKIAKEFINLNFKEIEQLLNSEIHEFRLTALIILVLKFKKAYEGTKKTIFDFYLKNTKNINNWDLVDLTAPNIIGTFLLNKDQKIIYQLAKSKNLWERRIAMLSTFAFIRENRLNPTLRVGLILINDKNDLIQKAVGWMLREVGKRNQEVEEEFLAKYYKQMGRTALRYAIEKFSDKKRKYYLG